MKNVFNFLFSFSFMGFLLLVLAFSMAMATFIESSYSTAAARGVVYNAWWFELIFVLLGINLTANFIRRKMYLPQRLSIGLFHLSFIVIIVGAAITRYIGFEGMMHIREGQTVNTILSTDDYFTITSGKQTIEHKVLLSELCYGQIDETLTINGRRVTIRSVGFVDNALRTPVDHSSGAPLIDFVISEGQGMESFAFRQGDQTELNNVKVGFDVPDANIRFFNRADSLFVVSDRPVEIRSMGGGVPDSLKAGQPAPVQTMHLYAFDGYLLLVKKFYEKAVMRVSRDPSGKSGESAVVLQVSDGTNQQTVNVFGRHGLQGNPVTIAVGSTQLSFTYGAKPIILPFAFKLNDFQLEKYPGSESPSSFASELTLIDQENQVNRNVRVFMNNTVSYHGYKFFQSSYDPDEQGTVLSVNADKVGTTVTYIGYFLLFLGIVWSLLNKNSYFHMLIQRLKQQTQTAAVALLLLLIAAGTVSANETDIAGIPKMDKELVNDFSRLWVHGHDGRIEPVSTLASEFLRKVSRQSSFEGKSPEEVMLSLYLYPELWRNVPLVKVSGERVKELLQTTDNRLPLTQFFDDQGNYKLAAAVKEAYGKMPAFRNQADKDLINADERVNVCFMVIHGDMLPLFPTGNRNDAWLSPGATPTGLPSADSLFINRGFELLKEAVSGSGEIKPRQIIASIATFQEKFGKDLLPSENKKNVEIFYNTLNPFKRVFPIYLSVGFVLLLVLFVNIFRQKNAGKITHRIFFGIIIAGFLLHTAGLGLRWYIAGHAPWSNGYESIVYVAWAAMLAGIIFGRKYPMVLGTAAMLAGITLFVAHLNWMNPEVTNLVPVLKSYWLLIHVAIITASYGFIALSAFMGLLVLVLYCISNEQNKVSVLRIVEQLTTINEMSVTIGLYMLTIGTFLGGIWANESWGRYWGWDPKETWALISVVIYSFVAHMRLIPSLRGTYNFNVAVVLGFAAILMTYFGVNYYLSGLHSYGRGTAGSVHWAVYVAGVIIVGVLILSGVKQKSLEENT